jgi:proton-translocating NADH-quinone oxidoreductase chain M
MLPIIALMMVANLAGLGAIAVSGRRASKMATVAAAAASLALTLVALLIMAGGGSVAESWAYLPYLGVALSFGLSGVSALLLLMSNIVILVAALSGNPESEKIRLSGAMMTAFQMAAIGIFSSANLLLFFIFWDIGVVALFVMINVLGSANRRAASINFLVYEIFASAMLLLGILLIYAYAPSHTLSIGALRDAASAMPANVQMAVFVLLFIAFMTNMPIFPMHLWLPDAHTEASTQGSMLLSGILTKFGGFGMLLLFSLLPVWRPYAGYIAALATVSAVYSALIMIRQTDLKRVIAYSTIVEMGVILVAISAGSALGSEGAAYGMLSHGLTVALMFLSVGTIKYMFKERSTQRLRGLISAAGASSYAFIVGALSMVGFPLTSGFIADLFIFLGAVQSFGIYGLAPLAAILVMGAFMYTLISKDIISTRAISKSVDFAGIDIDAGYAVLAGAIVLFGVMPFLALGILRL